MLFFKSMKRLNLLFLLIAIQSHAQKNEQVSTWRNQILNDTTLYKREFKDSLISKNFSSLWTHTDNGSVYGFIGDGFQRIQIKIISAEKDTGSGDTYNIYGKSKVKNNICEFHGTIKITNIRIFKHEHWGADDEFKNNGIKKQGLLLANYYFIEDLGCSHSGIFEGVLSSNWYLDKHDHIKYDDIELQCSDGFRNNQFVGTWNANDSSQTKTCNWGDYRIPFSDKLDCGVGEFYPANEFIKMGWATPNDVQVSPNQIVRQEDTEQWWK